MSKRMLLAMAGIGVLVAGTCAVAGTSLVPTSVMIGPCLKDLTSPSSYQPRVSPLATLRVPVGDGTVQVCYGRPAARGRTIFGELVPYGSPWRTGANEPTRLYVDRPILLGGLPVGPGRYSIYTEPTPDRWTFFLSTSVLHWGNDISPAVRAREVGRVVAAVEPLAQPVETLTVRSEPGADGTTWLIFEWERTRAVLEVRPGSLPSGS